MTNMNPDNPQDPNIQDPTLPYTLAEGVQPGAAQPASVVPYSEPDNNSVDAMLLEHARNAGIPVIENPHHELDPAAVRAVPEETGVIGVGYTDGFLVVAWPRIPRPQDIDHVASKAGMPIRIAVATEGAFEALWQ